MRSAERASKTVAFRVTNAVTGCYSLRGGCNMGFGLKSTTAPFVYMTHSAVVISFETALPLRTREKGGSRERPPPQQGGHAARYRWRLHTPLYRPPWGRSRPHLSLREGLEKNPFPLALHRVGSVLAVKGSLRRFAPWTAPGRSERRAAHEGKKGGRAVGCGEGDLPEWSKNRWHAQV